MTIESWPERTQLDELGMVRDRRHAVSDFPDELWDEMERAAELADELEAEGRRLSFDIHPITGRAVVRMCDREGSVLRPVGLRDAIDTTTDPPDAA